MIFLPSTPAPPTGCVGVSETTTACVIETQTVKPARTRRRFRMARQNDSDLWDTILSQPVGFNRLVATLEQVPTAEQTIGVMIENKAAAGDFQDIAAAAAGVRR